MTPNIQIYQSDDGHLELKIAFDHETVWLSLDQMACLFNHDKSVISRHLHAVVAKNATTAADGKIYQVDYYHLEVLRTIEHFILLKSNTEGTYDKL